MPIENLEDQGLEKNPNLELAYYKFLLTLPEYKSDRNVHSKVSEAIKKDGKQNKNHLNFLLRHQLFTLGNFFC